MYLAQSFLAGGNIGMDQSLKKGLTFVMYFMSVNAGRGIFMKLAYYPWTNKAKNYKVFIFPRFSGSSGSFLTKEKPNASQFASISLTSWHCGCELSCFLNV